MRYVCPECGEGRAEAGPCAHDGEACALADDPLLGTTVGAYRFARALGAGGMGRVYLAVHPSIGARVAIKVLAADRVRDREGIQRFFDEARAASLASHERIVRVHDMLSLPDGTPCLIMEYLEGASLAAIVEQGPVPAAQLVPLALEILEALGTAHAAGVVHRDLKPENVFVSRAGHAKILDFGIAKLNREGAHGPTRTGAVLGTPAYSSPEQIRESKDVDGRSDLYSLGVLLYEALSGHLPFEARNTFDLMRMHLEATPRPLRQLVPQLPDDLEAAIARALVKDPADRFSGAREMEAVLRAVAARLPVAGLAERVARVESGPRTVRMPRHAMVAAGTTMAAPETAATRPLTPVAADRTPVRAQEPAGASPPRTGAGARVLLALALLAVVASVLLFAWTRRSALTVVVPPTVSSPAAATSLPPTAPSSAVRLDGAEALDVTGRLAELQTHAARHVDKPIFLGFAASNVGGNGLVDITRTGVAIAFFVGTRKSPNDTGVEVSLSASVLFVRLVDAPPAFKPSPMPRCSILRARMVGPSPAVPFSVAYGASFTVPLAEGWRISGGGTFTDAECMVRPPRPLPIEPPPK